MHSVPEKKYLAWLWEPHFGFKPHQHLVSKYNTTLSLQINFFPCRNSLLVTSIDHVVLTIQPRKDKSEWYLSSNANVEPFPRILCAGGLLGSSTGPPMMPRNWTLRLTTQKTPAPHLNCLDPRFEILSHLVYNFYLARIWNNYTILLDKRT